MEKVKLCFLAASVGIAKMGKLSSIDCWKILWWTLDKSTYAMSSRVV